MTTILLIAWLALIFVSYKAAVFALGKTGLL
jgi:hypothetical protein